MDPELIARAAAARRDGVAERADRPSQRRCSQEAGAGAYASVRAPQMALREADDAGGPLVFEGYASVVETPYEMYDFFGPYTEIVSAGAFETSLNRADLDVPLVLQHQSMRRIARTTNGTLHLSEDEHGLHVLADQLDPTDADVAYIAPKLRAGLIDEMSFMFKITRGHWSPDYAEYRIDEVDLHRGDVAIVGYGANPHTVGAGLRHADLLQVLRSLELPAAREALAVLSERVPAPRRAPIYVPEEQDPRPFVTPVS